MTIQQAFELAVQHHQSGRLAEAEAIYRQILAAEPRYADALHLLGVIAHQMGRNEAAVDLIRQAIALAPGVPDFHSNLGMALYSKGQLDEAIASYRRAIALNPQFPEARNNLGIALRDEGRVSEAIAAYRQAIALKPDFPEAHSNLSVALKDEGQLDHAIAACRQAIALKPNFSDAHSNLGVALKAKGQLEEAIAAYRQAVAFKPNFPEAHDNLGTALKDKGQLDEAIAAFRQAITLKPNFPESHSNLVYTLHFHPGFDAQTIAGEHQRWNQQHAEPLRRFVRPHANECDPQRRLRVGYVSPDFREHVVGYHMLPLLACHDRDHFEIFCYAQVTCPDALTERFRASAQHWRSTVGLSHERLTAQIREDQIDILVDLTLHMAHNRLPVFARKPAPVQVTFAAYPGSTESEYHGLPPQRSLPRSAGH